MGNLPVVSSGSKGKQMRWKCAQNLPIIFVDAVQSIDVKHPPGINSHQKIANVRVDVMIVISDSQIPQH